MEANRLERAEPDWLLSMGDEVLGALWLKTVDQPWYHCTFEPAPAFEVVRSLFEAAERAVEADDFDKACDLLDALADKGVHLIWGNGQIEPRPDMEGSLQLAGEDMMFRPDNVRFEDGKPVPA